MDLDRLRKLAARATERRRSASSAVRTERKAIESYRKAATAARKARDVLQAVAATVQSQAHRQLTAVVTKCLQTVFEGGGYSFKINFPRRRGKTDAEMVFVRNGVEIDPTSSDSGGVTEVAAFALRLSCLLLARPARRRLLVLDEPFRAVSKEFVPAVKEMLETLAKDLDLQIILVTHNADLATGKVIEFGG